MKSHKLSSPQMNILMLAIMASVGLFGGLGISILSYLGIGIVPVLILTIFLFLGILVPLILLLSFGSWKK